MRFSPGLRTARSLARVLFDSVRRHGASGRAGTLSSRNGGDLRQKLREVRVAVSTPSVWPGLGLALLALSWLIPVASAAVICDGAAVRVFSEARVEDLLTLDVLAVDSQLIDTTFCGSSVGVAAHVLNVGGTFLNPMPTNWVGEAGGSASVAIDGPPVSGGVTISGATMGYATVKILPGDQPFVDPQQGIISGIRAGGGGSYDVTYPLRVTQPTYMHVRVGATSGGSVLVPGVGSFVFSDYSHPGDVSSGTLLLQPPVANQPSATIRVGQISPIGTIEPEYVGPFTGGIASAANHSFSATFEDAMVGPTIRWTNSSGGAYDVPGNWDPNQVPVQDASRADVAVFDAAGSYGVTANNATASRWLISVGTLNLSGDAQVFSTNVLDAGITILKPARLQIGSGRVRSATATIGSPAITATGAATAPAEVTLGQSGSVWENSGVLSVGNMESGRLFITNGQMSSAESRVGGTGGASGDVVVSGPQSFWDAGALHAGFGGAASTVTVESGGILQSTDADLSASPGKAAVISVEGTGGNSLRSTWSGSGELRIGVSGSGFVEVGGGGLVKAANVRAGAGASASGEINVSGRSAAGQPAAIETAGEITIGDKGSGGLTISQSGVVSAASVHVGVEGVGRVNVGTNGPVAGALSMLVVTNSLTIGSGPSGSNPLTAFGELNVFADGQVVSGPAVVGESTPGFANLRGTGAAPSWIVQGSLTIGSSNVLGELRACPDGWLQVSGDVVVNPAGRLEGSGRVATPNLINHGRLSPGCSPGTQVVDGNFTQTGSGVLTLEIAGSNPGQYDVLEVRSNAILGGTIELVFQNNFVPRPGDQFPMLKIAGTTQGSFAQSPRGNPFGGLVNGVWNNGTFSVTSVSLTNYQVLHRFGPTNVDGINGFGPLFPGSDGFFYGAARAGGPLNGGAVYRIRSEGFDYEVIHFLDPNSGGATPLGGVIEGSDGRLYGTASAGGTNNSGTVFSLNKDGSDFLALHHFAGTGDARTPQSELLEASDGRLYGTASAGGGFGRGGVFKLARDGTEYAVISGFNQSGTDDPRQPIGGLIQMPDGLLYGTSELGGSADKGTIYRIDTNGTFKVLKSLGLVAGGAAQPDSTLLRASDGLLYGTAALGGSSNFGAIFRIDPNGTNFAVVRSLGLSAGEAREPRAGLVEAPNGSLVGTSRIGGSANQGTVFRLQKDGSGYLTVWSFGVGTDGARSRAPLLQSPGGVFYGTTFGGGTADQGTIFRVLAPATIPSPTIVAHPASFVGPLEGPLTLMVQATGPEPLLFQWKLRGVDLPGETGPTLTIPNLTSATVGDYSVRVATLTTSTDSVLAHVAGFGIQPDGGLFLLGEPGTRFQIEYRDELAAPAGTWPVLTNLTLTTDNFHVTDPTPSSTGQRFYRALLKP